MSNEPQCSPSVSPTNAPVWGIGCSGVTVATIMQVDVGGREPGALDRVRRGRGRERRGGLVRAGDAPFADAGALDDPRVGRVDACFEIGVRDAPVGDRGSPADDRGRGAGHATRSQATGLTVAQALAGVREHAHDDAGERAADRLARARALDHADDLADGRRLAPSATPSGRNMPTTGATIMRSTIATRSPSRSSRGTHDGFSVVRNSCSQSAGVPQARTGMSGTVRLATPAIIEP